MNECERPNLSYLLSNYDYSINNNDWRPIQELLITRFAPTEYFDMFRTINQDCKFN